jgi:hypothetical protein
MHKTYYNIVLARRTTFLDYFLLSMHIFCYNSTRGAYYLFWPLVLRTWKNRNLLFFSDRLVLYHTILTLAYGWLESPGHLEDATSATALVEEKARHHVSRYRARKIAPPKKLHQKSPKKKLNIAHTAPPKQNTNASVSAPLHTQPHSAIITI